jgi:hypothetical protein
MLLLRTSGKPIDMIVMFRALGVGVLIQALSLAAAASLSPNTSIAWTPCFNSSLSRECGDFEVPLDYHNLSAGTTQLAVIRVNATKLPRLGTLFLNPGGPGLPGVWWLEGEELEVLIRKSGGQYDLVSESRNNHG